MPATACKTLMLLTIALFGAGCQMRGAAEPFGKTFYLGGASNIDVLTSGVPDGLRQAGYRGDVQTCGFLDAIGTSSRFRNSTRPAGAVKEPAVEFAPGSW